MQPIASAVLDNLVTQAKHVALTDCFYSWDDEVNMEVMFGGLSDRLSAMGKDIKIIGFKRDSLDEVKIYFDDVIAFRIKRSKTHCGVSLALCDFMAVHNDVNLYLYTERYLNMFSKAELTKLCVWAIENLHH